MTEERDYQDDLLSRCNDPDHDALIQKYKELEEENKELEEKMDALYDNEPTEVCSFCHQPQQDWHTPLRHYDTCPEIKRTRLLL